MIPDEAVEAAMSALGREYGEDAICREREYVVTTLESAAPHMLIHVHHHDIEAHAASYNEGYDAAVTQGLADDPSLAYDWLQGKIREAQADAWIDGAVSVMVKHEIHSHDATNPFRSES